MARSSLAPTAKRERMGVVVAALAAVLVAPAVITLASILFLLSARLQVTVHGSVRGM